MTAYKNANKFLIVQDSLLNQKVTIGMLESGGYQNDLVINGFEAMEAGRRNDYYLVLMDNQMPLMGGMEATRKIRA